VCKADNEFDGANGILAQLADTRFGHLHAGQRQHLIRRCRPGETFVQDGASGVNRATRTEFSLNGALVVRGGNSVDILPALKDGDSYD